jgi:hypothetical protein
VIKTLLKFKIIVVALKKTYPVVLEIFTFIVKGSTLR